MITNPADYFTSGCGRCAHFDTPLCKVHIWQKELNLLRSIALECGLVEEAKWGHPVYTFENHNVVMIGAFKDNCVLSFFKGALLSDEQGILTLPGENSQVARVVRFTDLQKVVELKDDLTSYIYEAIEIEKAGLKPTVKSIEEYPIPEEFQQKMAESPALKSAFEKLTPGRQKGYLLHFSQPKQAQTRISRIEKCAPKILQGKGFYD
ncbi:MAG: YdeI/OmpD-associated family protein [Saprospiraceae bacterium]|nr:YdeI/OmpD-associated family protein [Saprospiraceae bacterium]